MGILNDLYSFRDLIIKSDKKLLSTGELALWYALKLFQSESSEEIYVLGRTLEKCTGLSHKGFYKARDKLIQKGFINYIPDSNVNKSGIYTFMEIEKVHTEAAKEAGMNEKVHTETADKASMNEKVHTEAANEANLNEKVHTEEIDYRKLFGVEDNILKTNTFNSTSKMFKRMIKNEQDRD